MTVWDLHAELEALRALDLERKSRTLSDVHGPHASVNGRDLLLFCSNDYLGLADHPVITDAFIRESRAGGVGSGASHLVTGHRPVHDALAEALADWLQRESVLLFSTGYMANLGVINALLGRKDRIHQDRLNHASLLDGGLLSMAAMRRYAHADPADLETGLQMTARRHLVATDGVFSMDGDMAPLRDLRDACRRHGAALLVDDAHGLGVVGREGRGSLELAGLSQADVPLLVGTLGKAFGTFGAFVAGPRDWIELLRQRARTYIYTTAPPPAVAAATLASLQLVREESWRRAHLRALIARFRKGARALGLQLMPSSTPVQPLIIGDAASALAASRMLEEHGILVTAIRPPTVPAGSARLRVTLTAAHDEGQVDRLLDALAHLRAYGGASKARREQLIQP